jgi:hypothetical protein
MKLSPAWWGVASLSTALIVVGADADAADGAELVAPEGGAVVTQHASLAPKPVASGARVVPGKIVRCERGCALRFEGGSSLALEPGASVRVGTPSFVVLERGKTANRAAQADVLTGRVVVHAGAQPFSINVAGTTALVQHGSAQAVVRGHEGAAAAVDGELLLKHANVWSLIAQGHGVVFPAKGPSREVDVLSAPSWSTTTDDSAGPIAIALGPEGIVGATFRAPKGLSSTRVLVTRDEAGVEAVERFDLAADQIAFHVRLSPGIYFARLSAVDAFGLASAPTSVRRLRVVRAELPAGASAEQENRLFVLPAARALHLVDASDLEVAADKRGFLPAPSDLTVGAAQETKSLFWLRHKSDPQSASPITLERRLLRADVEIAPRLPRWPSDPLNVTVKLEDPSERVDPKSVAPKLHVLLGIDELKVDWKNEGAAWTARVPPRVIHEHSVVRVIVTDDHDAPLGRGFVEVAP